MILTFSNQKPMMLNVAEIVSIAEAGVSSAWHGTNSFIKMKDGETISCDETVWVLSRKIENDQSTQ